MRFGFRKLLFLVGGAAIFATAGFAYMASNTVAPSFAGEGSGDVNGYQVYNITFTPADTTNGNIGYIHFYSVPLANDHTVNSWPAYGQVKADGNWYNCTFAWGGPDTRTNGWVAPTGSPPTGGTPQAQWTCDVRGTTNGISAGTSLSSLDFMIVA